PNSKTYGSADPTPLTTGSGNFLPADGVTATYSRVSGDNASPPTYHITATLSSSTGALGNYAITNAGAEFTINKAPCVSEYTGVLSWATTSATTYTATVTSSAFVTVTQGNIATARVTLYNDQYPTSGAGIPSCQNLVVGAVTATTGSVACQWTATVPSAGTSAGYMTTTVTAVLGGNYGPSSDTAAVDVTLPNQQNFIPGD